jgi:hypothetical protein
LSPSCAFDWSERDTRQIVGHLLDASPRGRRAGAGMARAEVHQRRATVFVFRRRRAMTGGVREIAVDQIVNGPLTQFGREWSERKREK